MKWQMRLLKNSVIGTLPIPLQEQLRSIKRSIVPHKLEIDLPTLRQGLVQVRMLKGSGIDPSGKDYLEIGTGWAPVIPMIFYLAGCKSLMLVDAQRLMDDHTFQETCRQMLPHSREISEEIGKAQDGIENKLARLGGMNLAQGLKEINGQYRAPYDVLKNDIPSRTIDIASSRAVLEHVPRDIIESMFDELYRLLRNNGAMCHIIDNSDHWEHEDKSICRLNFLKFSRTTFSIISAMNPLYYQNRLRHSQYMKLMEEAGFTIVYDNSPADEGTLCALDSLKLNSSFLHFSKDDLAVLTSCLVARKNGRK